MPILIGLQEEFLDNWVMFVFLFAYFLYCGWVWEHYQGKNQRPVRLDWVMNSGKVLLGLNFAILSLLIMIRLVIWTHREQSRQVPVLRLLATNDLLLAVILGLVVIGGSWVIGIAMGTISKKRGGEISVRRVKG